MLSYKKGFSFPCSKVSDMSRVQINRNKLHASLCMAASAVVSITFIYHAIKWLA